MQNDLERGERIKELRERSHMTQPAIASRVDVTLRAYQKWEEGGGLAWENLEALAELHNVTPQYIASGETPDLLRSLNGSVPQELQDQLDRIEASNEKLLDAIDDLKRLVLPVIALVEPGPEEEDDATGEAPAATG